MRRCAIACMVFVGLMAGCASKGMPEPLKADVCIYGGTSGGVAAAVAVVKQGKSVILVEPGRHLGGMTTGGLGFTDFGNKAVIGGISRTFYQQIGKHYDKDEAWTFEPGVAEAVYKDWISQNKVKVLFEHRLQELKKNGQRIESITLEHAPPDADGAPAAKAQKKNAATISAAMFIDATYEGDLMARAGVKYHVGRESVETYGEPLNGIRSRTPSHQFTVPTDPYVKAGDASSGLLPLIAKGPYGNPGEGDHRVQAYNFRMCLAQDKANQIPISEPKGYDEKRFEVFSRYLENLAAAKKPANLRMLLKIDMMPNGKTDINNNGAVSTDFIGENYAYPDGDYAMRNRIWKAHQQYIRELLYFLGHGSRVPQNVKDDMLKWGYAKDEFTDTGGWPHQMYIREARRMIGQYVVTQADCEHKKVCDDSVGMGAYNMDSHNCQRLVRDGRVENEGDVQVRPTGPYPVSYKAITPKAEQCENLLVPVCLSASHIAYGSIRMEPVFMVIGESAAIAACQAIDEKKSVQEIDPARLEKSLKAAGQVLYLKK